MKISCPQCGATGTIPDHEIPEEGRFLSCPKCKHGFDVKKPRATTSEYLVDSCPACAYSTFGDERFSTCPKCGVVIKTYVERQREEMARAREQQILTRKFSRDAAPPPPPPPPIPGAPYGSSAPEPASKSMDVAEMIENLNPPSLVGYGTALAAVVIMVMSLYGLIDYMSTDYSAMVSAESIELGIAERPSGAKIFFQHGLLPWLGLLYGAVLLGVAVLFLQKKAQARQALAWMLWTFIAFVPSYYLIILIGFFFKPMIPRFFAFFAHFLEMTVVSGLVGYPLYLLIQFLDDKRIKSVVRL